MTDRLTMNVAAAKRLNSFRTYMSLPSRRDAHRHRSTSAGPDDEETSR